MTSLGSHLLSRCERESDWRACLDRIERAAWDCIEGGVQVTAESFEGYSVSGIPACSPKQLLDAVNEVRAAKSGMGSRCIVDFSCFELRT